MESHKKRLLYIRDETGYGDNVGTFHGTLDVKCNFVTAELERALRDIMIIFLFM